MELLNLLNYKKSRIFRNGHNVIDNSIFYNQKNQYFEIITNNTKIKSTNIIIATGACRQDKRTLFINCHELLIRRRTAYEKGMLERVLRRYARYELLIIDEIAYLPIQKHEADLNFQLLNMWYETHSTVFITNFALSAWDELFRILEMAAAILD